MEDNNYKIMVEMLNSMKTSLDSLKTSISNRVRDDYKLKDDIIDASLPYKIGEIENIDEIEIRDIFNKYAIDDTYKYDSTEKLYEVFTTIKNMSLLLISSEKEYADVKRQSSEIMNDYLNYMSSDKVKEAREERLSKMKELRESETDEIQKKKISSIIEITEASKSFSFVTKRLEKYGEKEIENIMDGFFNDKKGKLMIEKYNSRIKQFGYNPDIYKYFFNIEENFLPEEYYDFNNLFLFIYMRMVAYSDPYKNDDKMFIRALTGGIAELFYHKMDKEDEKEFIEVIKKTDDYFKEKKEFFTENNTTSPNHPERKAQIKHLDEQRIENMKEKLKELKYNEEIPEDISADDLQKIFENYLNKLVDEQIKPDQRDEDENSVNSSEE